MRVASGGHDGGAHLQDTRFVFYPLHSPASAPANQLLTGDLTQTLGRTIDYRYHGRTFTTDGIGGPTYHWIFSDAPNGITRWRRAVPEGLGGWSLITFTIDTDWTDAEAAQAGWSRFSTDTGHKSWRETIRSVTRQTFYSGDCEVPCASRFTHRTGIDDVRVEGMTQADETVRLGSPPNANVLLRGATSGPVIGQSWDPRIDHATFVPNASIDALLLTALPSNIATPFGTLLCDLTFPPLVFSTSPGSTFAVAIPNSCQLAGSRFCTQGVSVESSGAFAFSNAIDITIGT